MIVLVAATQVFADTKLFCQGKWPGNFRMQRHCVHEEREAAWKLMNWLQRHGATVGSGRTRYIEKARVKAAFEARKLWAVILSDCVTRWPETFRMQLDCVGRQEAAARERGRALKD